MADSVPPSVVSLLAQLVDAAVMQQAQIAELQGDRTTLLKTIETLTAAVTELQNHAESVAGESGLTSQLGDLTQVPALQKTLAAAMPALAEAAPGTDASVAGPAQDPAIQAAA